MIIFVINLDNEDKLSGSRYFEWQGAVIIILFCFLTLEFMVTLSRRYLKDI